MDLAQSLAAAVKRAEGQLLKGIGSNSYVNGFQKLHQLQEAAWGGEKAAKMPQRKEKGKENLPLDAGPDPLQQQQEKLPLAGKKSNSAFKGRRDRERAFGGINNWI